MTLPYNYLVDHALKNIWCNNAQDNQRIICAQKIVHQAGVKTYFKLLGRCCSLPISNKKFHIYQIGQIYPDVLGLVEKNPVWVVEQWVNMKDAVNNLKLFIDIYNTSGVQFPRFKTWYMFSKEKDLIIAIEEDSNIPLSYMEDKIYVRLYTNAYYQLNVLNPSIKRIYSNGLTITTNAQILALETELATYRSMSGGVYCYKNGFLINDLSLFTISLGDTVEFIYDSSIKGEVIFTIKDLNLFQSILDLKMKYLLHYVNIFPFKEIEYHDDVDFYILDNYSITNYNGLYYHRNSKDAVRMVTHKDYSLITEYVKQYSVLINNTKHSGTDDILNYRILLRIRNSGYERELVYNSSRIHELYKLSDDKIVMAMVGVNSCIDEWKAENLEKSFYTKIMKSNKEEVTDLDAQEAYGYNAASYYLGYTPQIPTYSSGTWNINLNYNQIENSTMYEYNEDGLLILTQQHINAGTRYNCGNNNTRLIETFIGRGQYDTRSKFGEDGIDISEFSGYSIRVYMCRYFNGLPDNNWVDITGSDHYRVENNRVLWNNLTYNQFLMVRSDKYFLSYEFDLGLMGGNLYFTLSELEDRDMDGISNNHELPVPLGDLDIWLNGHSLIRGLDYIIDFPTIYIITKEYFVHPLETTLQHINVRFHGFADANGTLDSIEDYGFVEFGLLSNNAYHNIRDDKVNRIVVGGCLHTKDQIVFSEQNTVYNNLSDLNGRPYMVKDIIVPMKGLTPKDTYDLRNEAIILDRKIEDYLSLYLPQPERTGTNVIPFMYKVVSPFLNHIIFDLKNNQFDNSKLKVIMSNMEITDITKEYEYLLKYDPIHDILLDNRYVIIHPHILNSVINLSYLQYLFVLRVIDLYANNRINNINSFITFTT